MRSCTHPYYELTERGIRVTIASPDGGKVEMDTLSDPRDPSKRSANDLITLGFVNSPDLMALLENTPKLVDLELGDYDALMVAGGLSPMFTYRDNDDLKHTIVQFYESEKPVGIYCHGTSALVDLTLSDGSYLVAGKTVTGFANVEEDYSDNFVGQKVMPWRIEDALRERGANYVQGGRSRRSVKIVNGFTHMTIRRCSVEGPSCRVSRPSSGPSSVPRLAELRPATGRGWCPSRVCSFVSHAQPTRGASMPDILHRFTIDAPRERVHDLIATREGVERWWNAHPNKGDDATLEVFFGGDDPAAVMQVVENTPEQIVWRVVGGPSDWIGTTVTFALARRPDDGTTLLFTHAGWREANEFMHGCSTNWGAYLTSLKSGAERGEFAAYPAGEMSRWS